MSENTNPTPVDRRNFLLTTAATGAALSSPRQVTRTSKMPMSASTSPSSVSADAARPT